MTENRVPSAIAIIPARGGSERVPNKNTFQLAGHPLLGHSIIHARQSQAIEEVYVSTDGDEIAEIAEMYGAHVVRRPRELATGSATSESALIHTLDARVGQGKADLMLLFFTVHVTYSNRSRY